MTQLWRSVAALRISGETLQPDEITRVLGAPPTLSRLKGDVQYRSKAGRETIAKVGLWLLEATDREPEDVNGQVIEILGKLTDDLGVWKSLSQRFDIDLYCGWFMRESNEALEISLATLAALDARRIILRIEMYAPSRD
jgi:Domain of unknown function (DUF4279)